MARLCREPSTSVLFLLPRQNQALWKPLLEVAASLKTSLAKRVHVVAIEDVLRKLAADTSLEPRLTWYVELLVEKYVPTAAAT